MKYEIKNSLNIPLLFITLTIMMSTSFLQTNVSFGQAVDLIPIHTGNATLDKDLPLFYDCIDEKIDESKGVEVDPYFEKEPTKHEVSTCYNEVFILNSEAQSSIDSSEAQSSIDSSEAQSSIDSSEAQSSIDSSEAQSSIDSSEAQSSIDNSEAQSSIDNSEAQSSIDSSERSDNERFNSLFGFTG